MVRKCKDAELEKRYPVICSLKEDHRCSIIDLILKINKEEELNYVEECLSYSLKEELFYEVSYSFLAFYVHLEYKTNIRIAVNAALDEWDL